MKGSHCHLSALITSIFSRRAAAFFPTLRRALSRFSSRYQSGTGDFGVTENPSADLHIDAVCRCRLNGPYFVFQDNTTGVAVFMLTIGKGVDDGEKKKKENKSKEKNTKKELCCIVLL